METRLIRRTHGPGMWVRSSSSGRTLGTVERVRSKWFWTPCSSAFRGDGRPGLERDGAPTDRVPAELVELPVDDRTTKTRETAVEALVDYLAAQQAPVAGFGPHPRVTPGLPRPEDMPIRRAEEVLISRV